MIPRLGVRRAVGLAAMQTRRLAGRWEDATLAIRRHGRYLTGRLELPDAAWGPPKAPSSSAASSTPRLVPLPAPRALLRELTGQRLPSLDAYAPLGEAPDNGEPTVLLPVGAAFPGSWTVAETVTVLSRRPSLSASRPLRCLLVAGVSDLPPLRAALRGLAPLSRRGVVLTGLGDEERLARALTAVDAVVVPRPDDVPPHLRHTAAGHGRAVLGPDALHWERVAAVEAGRRARQAHALREPMPPWAPPELPLARVHVGRESRRVVVAGHDLKFAGGLIDVLRAEGHDVRLDPWRGHARHDEARSRALAVWADVVHCEWSLGNLVWYSRHVPSGTRLTSRLHLQEAATPFPARARADALDAWIFVAPHVREQVLRDTGFPPQRAHWIPNGVAVPPGSDQAVDEGPAHRRFTLGMVGVLPERKGLHRALEVLALLRAQDDRYTLRIRGHHPREVEWMSGRPGAQSYYSRQERRIAQDPLLAGAVAWDPHGPDMPAWFSRIGVALSTSDFESFHFTLPDGAVHGCLPRSLSWAGADILYPTTWLYATTADLAASIRTATAEESVWRALTQEARKTIVDTYDESVVLPALVARVLGKTVS